MVVIGNKRNKKARNRLPQKKRRQWNVREKLMVIHYFENKKRNVRGTSKKFDIQPKQVHEWVKKKEALLVAAPHVAKLHLGKPAKYPKLEDDLFVWIGEKRASEHAVSQKLITNKAISLSRNKVFLASNLGIADFKFSNKWLNVFLRRYDLEKHRRIMVSQILPQNLIEIQNIFLSYIMYLRIHNKYPLKYIGNMDETPMWFDLPSNTTINQKDAKTVNICTTGHERTSFTVVLRCMANGTKLPAVCIFKLKNIPKEKFPRGIYIRVNEKEWVNEQEMLWWIEIVWTSRNPFGNPRSMLVLDSFRGHIVESVKNRLIEKNTNIAVIPGGYTSKLQPLDVTINKSFKFKVKDRYNDWMISNIHAFTPTGKIKRPSYSTVATWVKELWDEVDVSIIQNSFKCCGIFTKLDSSEDNCLFNYQCLLNQVNVDDDEVIEDPNPEEYPEKTNYENDWNIEEEINEEGEQEIEEEINDNEKEDYDYVNSDDNDEEFKQA